jgi:hypothetical protein
MRKFITDILAKANLGVEQNAYVLGTVGIGTSTPNAPLQVVGTGAGAVGTLNLRGSSVHMGLTSSGGTFKGWYGYFNAATHGSEADLNIKTGYAGTSNIRFSADGDTTPAMLYIASAGNVGIGTTAPAVKFHVDGGKSLSRTTDSSWGQSAVANPNDAEVGFVWAAGGTGYPGVTSTYTRQWIAGLNPFGTGMDRWSLTNKTLGANTAITVLEGGNVGIGTTGPSAKLQVAGEIRASLGSTYGYVALQTGGATVQGYVEWFKPGPGRVGYMGYNDGSTANNLALTLESGANFVINNGNVGIGTASPIAKLSVYTTSPHSSPTGISVAAGAGGANLLARNTEYHNWFPYTDGNNYYSADNHIFRNASHTVDWVRITSGGNVGISTTSPANKLVVTSDASPTNENTYAIAAASASDPAYKTIIGYDYTNDIGLIAAVRTGIGWRNLSIPQGSLGIGTYSPGYKLEVNGTLGVNGNATFNGGNVYINSDNSYIGNNTTDLVSLSGGTMYLPGNGNVGIGTTAPGAKLDIVSTGSGSEGLRVDGSSGGFAFVVKGGSDYTSHIRAGATIGVNYFVTPPSNGLIVEGNVGIGTTSPSQKLHVVGNQYITGNITVGASGNYSNVNFVRNDGAGVGGIGWRSDGIFYVGGHLDYGPNAGNNVRVYGFGANLSLGNNTSGDVLNITNAGNVGIGTSSPGYKLQVVGEIYTNYRVQINDGTANLIIGHWDGVNTRIENSGGRPLLITSYSQPINMSISGSGPAFSLKADSNAYFTGSLGIGTTSPAAKLHIAGGDVWVNTVSTLQGMQFGYSGPSHGSYRAAVMGGPELYGGTDSGMLTFHTQNGYVVSATPPERMRITSAGNVGIGTTGPGWKLDVIGDVRASSYFVGGSSGQGFSWGNFTYGSYIDVDNGQNALRIRNTSGTIMLEVNGYLNYFTGKLGIGNNSPTYNLDVTGTGRFTSGLLSDSLNAVNYPYSLTLGTSGADAGSVTITAGSTSGYNTSIYVGGGGASVAPNNIVFNTASAERMRILSNGNVGIGTTSPATLLDVRGEVSVAYSATYGLRFYNDARNNWSFIGNSVSGSSSANLRFGDATGEVMRITGGNVGIGTTSPTAKFQVTDASSSITLQNYLNGAAIFLDGVNGDFIGADYFHILADGSSYLGVGGYAGGATPLNVSNSGNVGIGTTSPGAKLDIAYSINPTTATPHIILTTGGASKQAAITAESFNVGGLVFSTGDGTLVDRMTILRSNGNVGIGTTTPSEKLHVIGKGIFESNVRIYPVSESWAEGLSFIMPTAGNWGGLRWQRQRGNNDGNWYIGFTALDSTDDLVFGANNGGSQVDNIIRLTKAGNVGIGTTSPGASLEVDGSFNIKNGDGNITHFNYVDGSTNYVRGTTYFDTAPVYFTGGNVGIGTTSPFNKLTVGSVPASGYGLITISADWASGSAISTGIKIGAAADTGGAGVDIRSHSNYAATSGTEMSFWTNSTSNVITERMRITSGGNVSIGTESTVFNSLLNVAGGINTTTGIIGYETSDAFTLNGKTQPHYGFNLNPTGSSLIGISGYFGIALATQGSERMRILQNGNVGIGTSSPNYKLHVSGNAYINETLFVNQLTTIEDSLIVYDNLGVGTTTPTAFLHIAGQFESNYALKLSGTYGTGRTFGWKTNGGDSNVISLYDVTQGSRMAFFGYTQIGFEVNGVSRLYIADGGNVGIGTTSPSELLEVVGNIRANISNGGGFMLTGASASGLVRAGATGLALRTNTTDRLTVDNSGNVGIGTTSPTVKLHVADSDGGRLILQSIGGSGINWQLNSYTDGKLYIGNYGVADYVAITPAGNVGIGTTSPSEKLHIVGSNALQIIQSTTGGQNSTLKFITTARTWGIGANMGLSNSNLEIYDYTASANRLTIDSSGNVGIGTASPAGKLHVYSTTSSDSIGHIQYENGSTGTGSATNAQLIGKSKYGTLQYMVWESSGARIGMRSTSNGGSGNLYFTTGTDSVTLTMLATGNVGIGTSSPTRKLDVISTSEQLRLAYDSSGTVYTDFRSDSAGGLLINTSNSYIINYIGGSEKMRITSSGNVGIGTTDFTDVNFGSPALKIAGSRATLGLTSSGTLATIAMIPASNTAKSIHLNQSSDGSFRWYQYSVGAETFVLDAAGNVGIGTTSPVAALHVQSSSTKLFLSNTDFVANTTGSGMILHTGASSGNTYSQIYAFQSGNTAYANLVIPGGNVGIGTTSPTQLLHLVGTNAANNGLTLQNTNASGNSQVRFLNTSGTERAAITYINSVDGVYHYTAAGGNLFNLVGGNVGIGTTGPSYKLHVEGNTSGISIYASHDIAAFSDITVKKEVKRIENAIEKVKELNGYTYVRTDDETGTRRAGVIAQEVQKVLPEVVSANPDGTLNVAYSNMIALLIEGMKEQQATIERMQQEINELKK